MRYEGAPSQRLATWETPGAIAEQIKGSRRARSFLAPHLHAYLTAQSLPADAFAGAKADDLPAVPPPQHRKNISYPSPGRVRDDVYTLRRRVRRLGL